jgi:hypothetical protein
MTFEMKGITLGMSRPHPTAYIEPEIPENGPVLDEKCLFVRVLGLSGTAGGDSNPFAAVGRWQGKLGSDSDVQFRS